MPTYRIERRGQVLVNNDPQRRCYDGCHAKSEVQWTDWEVLEPSIPEDRIKRRVEFWRELNDYAVSERGEGARSEFRSIPNEEPSDV